MVRNFELGHQEAGTYEAAGKAVYWDGRNNLGDPLAAGVYFYNLSTENYTKTRKTSIMK